MTKTELIENIEFITGIEFKTKFERNLRWAQEQDRVIYYDYLSYKRAAGWWTGLINDDWNRPSLIEKAKYNGEFLKNLPDYYFLGFPIKELLKLSYANGHCHACAIALSLYFKDFEVVTCNLQNYADHYSIKSGRTESEYEHTFLLVNLEGKRTVIDTTFGFITDLDTYKKIFNPNKIRIITSEQLEKVKPYQYIKSLKDYKGMPPGFNEIYDAEKKEWFPTEEKVEYQKIIHEYMDICSNYSNNENAHLQDFINRCLFRTSNSASHSSWRTCLEHKIVNAKYEYPQTNLFSLEDDEFDENLYSTYKDTIERNKRILDSYHKEQVPETSNLKNKLLKLVRNLKK